jgi:hypothetical protein
MNKIIAFERKSSEVLSGTLARVADDINALYQYWMIA